MFYDYEDEDFYTENEYQEEIDNLKEAIKKSVKRETTEEMNRLREENKKLQGIKENFDTVKKDFEPLCTQVNEIVTAESFDDVEK